MIYHIAALVIGCILDRIVGDPINWPHPIRLIGKYISILTDHFLKIEDGRERDNKREFRLGILMVVVVIATTTLISMVVMILSYRLNPIIGMLIEAILTCYILAARSLKDESMKVYQAMDKGDIEGARFAVSMIVGRDTDVLDKDGIIKAAVETVAENTSDGVIAPLIYTAFGGPVLGWIYKSINTMDSMVGYKNEKYMYFGRAAAKTDDFVNFLPSRISAILMIAAAGICGREFSAKEALRVFLRDRFNHKSPNSAQTESVCAGALGVRLAGDAVYFGKLTPKPFIGDDVRPIENEDIKRSNKLMYITELLSLVASLIILVGVWFVFKNYAWW